MNIGDINIPEVRELAIRLTIESHPEIATLESVKNWPLVNAFIWTIIESKEKMFWSIIGHKNPKSIQHLKDEYPKTYRLVYQKKFIKDYIEKL